jgi:hypothetical protein
MPTDSAGRVWFCGSASAIAALTVWAVPTMAHQRQILQIDRTDYLVVVGFINESVYTGDKSGIDPQIMLPDPADVRAPEVKPMENLDKTLKVAVKAGPHAKVFDLTPANRAPGRYEAVFYPTVTTTYSVRLFGMLTDLPLDLSFACNPLGHVSMEDKNTVKLSEQVTRKALIGSFGYPSARADVEFPPASRSRRREPLMVTSRLRQSRCFGGRAEFIGR